MNGVAGHLNNVASFKKILIGDHCIFRDPTGRSVVGLKAEGFLVGGKEEGTMFLQFRDDDTLGCCTAGGCRFRGDSNLSSELVEEGRSGVDMEEHPKEGRGCIDKNTDEIADFEGCGMLLRAIFFVPLPASLDQIGASLGSIVFEIIAKACYKPLSGIVPFSGCDRWGDAEEDHSDVAFEVPAAIVWSACGTLFAGWDMLTRRHLQVQHRG